MNARCKPGDLAIVIDARYPCNLGKIVEVIRPDDGSGDIVYRTDAGPVWWCKASRPLKWTIDGKVFLRKHGPVPDTQLQPIRGLPDIAEDSASKADTAPRSIGMFA